MGYVLYKSLYDYLFLLKIAFLLSKYRCFIGYCLLVQSMMIPGLLPRLTFIRGLDLWQRKPTYTTAWSAAIASMMPYISQSVKLNSISKCARTNKSICRGFKIPWRVTNLRQYEIIISMSRTYWRWNLTCSMYFGSFYTCVLISFYWLLCCQAGCLGLTQTNCWTELSLTQNGRLECLY